MTPVVTWPPFWVRFMIYLNCDLVISCLNIHFVYFFWNMFYLLLPQWKELVIQFFVKIPCTVPWFSINHKIDSLIRKYQTYHASLSSFQYGLVEILKEHKKCCTICLQEPKMIIVKKVPWIAQLLLSLTALHKVVRFYTLTNPLHEVARQTRGQRNNPVPISSRRGQSQPHIHNISAFNSLQFAATIK